MARSETLERVRELREKTKAELENLRQRKEKIEEKIKDKEAMLSKYEILLNQKRFSVAEDVLHIRGLSLDDVLAAIQSGDLQTIQQQLIQNSLDSAGGPAENLSLSDLQPGSAQPEQNSLVLPSQLKNDLPSVQKPPDQIGHDILSLFNQR